MVCGIMLQLITTGASASGEWFWSISTNPATGSLHFAGNTGSSVPIVINGTIYNNDPANSFSFDGITLKTDDLAPNDPTLYESLWATDSSVAFPDAYSVAAGGTQMIKLGQFNPTSATPGTYSFRFTAAGRYDSLQSYQSELVSNFVTVDILPVPEPSSLLSLSTILASLGLVRRRSGSRAKAESP